MKEGIVYPISQAFRNASKAVTKVTYGKAWIGYSIDGTCFVGTKYENDHKKRVVLAEVIPHNVPEHQINFELLKEVAKVAPFGKADMNVVRNALEIKADRLTVEYRHTLPKMENWGTLGGQNN